MCRELLRPKPKESHSLRTAGLADPTDVPYVLLSQSPVSYITISPSELVGEMLCQSISYPFSARLLILSPSGTPTCSLPHPFVRFRNILPTNTRLPSRHRHMGKLKVP